MKLFRYESRVYATCSIDVSGGEVFGRTDPKLELHEYEVIKETPCGFWYNRAFTKRWVSRTAKKRYCYPSKQQALESFLIRKHRQIGILSTRLRDAEWSLRLGDEERLRLLKVDSEEQK